MPYKELRLHGQPHCAAKRLALGQPVAHLCPRIIAMMALGLQKLPGDIAFLSKGFSVNDTSAALKAVPFCIQEYGSDP